jgi:hypothetical protein
MGNIYRSDGGMDISPLEEGQTMKTHSKEGSLFPTIVRLHMLISPESFYTLIGSVNFLSQRTQPDNPLELHSNGSCHRRTVDVIPHHLKPPRLAPFQNDGMT